MVPLLLTRPAADSARFADAAQAAGLAVEPIIAPLMRMTYLPVPPLQADDVAVFTSRHAVRCLPAGAGRLAYVVGRATAQAAEAAGYRTRSADGDADALFRRIVADHTAGQISGRLHYIRGRHTRGDLVARLLAAGVQTTETIGYDQVAQGFDGAVQQRLERPEKLAVALFSPRSASLFAAECQRVQLRARLSLAAFSPAVAQALGDLAVVRCEIAEHPEVSHMIAALQKMLRNVDTL